MHFNSIEMQDICQEPALASLSKEVNDKWYSKKSAAECMQAVFSELRNSRYWLRPYTPNYWGDKAERISNCGSYMLFARKGDSFKLQEANFCRQRLCPMCSWRRSLKQYATLSSIMDVVQDRGAKFVFATFTIRNCSGAALPQTVDTLLSAFNRLDHDIIRKRKKGIVLGAARTLEVTYNPQRNDFHPHLHVVFAVSHKYFKSGYIKHQEWRSLWSECLGVDYLPMVRIEKVKALHGESYEAAVREVAKYTVKDYDILRQDTAAGKAYVTQCLDSALRGRRLFSLSGVFFRIRKELNLEDPADGDLIVTGTDSDEIRSDVAAVMFVCRWVGGVYQLTEIA